MSEVNKYFTMIGNILPITSYGVSFFLCHLVGLSRLPTPNVLHGPIKSLAFRPRYWSLPQKKVQWKRVIS